MTTKVLGLMASIIFISAAPAAAQAPTSDAYGGAGGVLGQVATGSTTTPPPAGNVESETTGSGDDTSSGVAGEAADGTSGGDRAGVAGERLEGVNGTTFAADTAAGSDSLPFTGLDVGLLAAGSLLLLALGFGLRRLGRRPTVA